MSMCTGCFIAMNLCAMSEAQQTKVSKDREIRRLCSKAASKAASKPKKQLVFLLLAAKVTQGPVYIELMSR